MTNPQPNGYFRGETRSRLYGKGLTDDDVRAIRLAEGSLREIGRTWGISNVMVHNIRKRKRWKHVSDVQEG